MRGTFIPGSAMTEIGSLDGATGNESLLVSNAQLTAALELGHRPAFDEEESEAGLRRLQNYAWSADGHALLLASSNALVWFDLDKHSFRAAAQEGTLPSGKEDRENLGMPQISPDGRLIGFTRGNRLFLADVASGAVRLFAGTKSRDRQWGDPDWLYRNEFAWKSAWWWSPNSNAIAFLETDDSAVAKYDMRQANGDVNSIPYPKPGGAIPRVRLIVMSLSGRQVVIDIGKDSNMYLPKVQWLPDGKHLAIERLSRDQKTLDLLIADASTGTSKTVLSEHDVYWVNLDDCLHFLSDSQRFVWGSERSGYRHLYLYDISGRQLAQLTKGQWEVTSVDKIDEVTGSVYFTATEAGVLERQVYRVSLDGSAFARVSRLKGTHSALFAPSAKLFLDTWSDHTSPPRQSLLDTAGGLIATIGKTITPEPAPDSLRQLEFLSVNNHMGNPLHAWMMKPPGFDPAHKYPVIVYVAGGPGDQIVRDVWGGDKLLWFSMMAEKGYVVFALDNRGSGAQGHLFEEPVHLRFSATEMADQRDGVLYLHSLPFVDSARIGICGWGFGGFLALHGMLDRPLIFKAGFAGSPITDWHLYDAFFAERYLDDPIHNQDGWLSSSPNENAGNLNGSLLLADATLDEKIHVENSLMLLDELLDKEKYADILLFPDRSDLFTERGTRTAMFQRLTEFFLKNL